MLNPQSPVPINATALALSSSPAVVPAQIAAGGDGGSPGTGAVPLAGMAWAAVSVDYTRAGLSSTGRPILQVQVSRDPPTVGPANVKHWQSVAVLDGSSFSSGMVDSYGEAVRCNPSAAGLSTFGWPSSIDVRGFGWLRLLAGDADGTNPGTLLAFLSGGV